MFELICDFCSRQPVTARYSAHSFTQTVIGDIGIKSDGDWAGCVDCAALIDAGDWTGLLDRTVNTFMETNPNREQIIAMIGPDNLRAELERIQWLFRSNRVVKV